MRFSLASTVVEGLRRSEEDRAFTFVVSGILPALSLISLWLINLLSSALQNIINHYRLHLLAFGKSWLLGWVLVAWGIRMTTRSF